MMAALGNESRLRVVRLLLSAQPDGLVVSEIQDELDIPGSPLSRHLEKLRHKDLLAVQREGTFMRYTVNTDAPKDVTSRCRWSPGLSRCYGASRSARCPPTSRFRRTCPSAFL